PPPSGRGKGQGPSRRGGRAGRASGPRFVEAAATNPLPPRLAAARGGAPGTAVAPPSCEPMSTRSRREARSTLASAPQPALAAGDPRRPAPGRPRVCTDRDRALREPRPRSNARLPRADRRRRSLALAGGLHDRVGRDGEERRPRAGSVLPLPPGGSLDRVELAPPRRARGRGLVRVAGAQLRGRPLSGGGASGDRSRLAQAREGAVSD